MTLDMISLQPAPGRENICAIIVTYFPDGDFLSRLRRIQPQVAHVVVIDNAATDEAVNSLKEA